MEKFNNKVGNIPALTDEERLLISRAAELSARCDYQAVASCFLSPREQRILYESGVEAGGFFYGGAPGATRRKLIFLPSWMEATSIRDGAFSLRSEEMLLEALKSYGALDSLDAFYTPVRLVSSGYEALSHRDWLGSLMALGIKRETLGDICFFGGETYVFAEPRAAEYIALELNKAGRAKVSGEICTLPEDFCPEIAFENISTTVASPRLDGVVRALCNISRESAADLVTSGLCEINYFTEIRPDTTVKGGDVVSLRGYGKYIIDSTDGVTKKGRCRLTARKYI